MNTPPFPPLVWSQVRDTSTHLGKTGTVAHFIIEWSISRPADGPPYVLRSYLAKHSSLRQHCHTVEQAKAIATKLWQQWLYRAGLQPLPVLEFMPPGEAQRAALNLRRAHQLDLMPPAPPPADPPFATVDRCSCGSTQYVYWLPQGSVNTWSNPQAAPPKAGEADPRCQACNKPWNSAPPKSAEVFSRSECVFKYCPHPEFCEALCVCKP